jgi:RecA-family ATPase
MDRKLWLWPDRIAERSVSLLAGEGGVGKGHITVEIVNTITNGGLWPDDRLDTRAVTGEVLWFCAEDDPATELKPRLVAAGVDLNKVHLFTAKHVKDKRDTIFSIEEDLALLDKHLAGLKDVRLVIFDPVTSYLHGRKTRAVDSHNATQLRAILQPLSELSHKHDVAILGITHFAKDSARRMIHRVIGSQVWTAVARSVLLATKLEPEMRSEQSQNSATAEYVMLSGKSNNAAETPAIRYQIHGVTFSAKTKKFPSGTAIETSRLHWLEVDRQLREEDLFGKSEKGPLAVKQANLERAVKRIFDEQDQEWLFAGVIMERLEAEGFGSSTRISKDLAGVAYLRKKNVDMRWMWAVQETKE